MKVEANGTMSIAHGDSLYKTFSYKTSAGVGYDFTGCKMRFIVRKDLNSTPIIDLDETSGITLTTGTILFSKVKTEMALLAIGQYKYDWIFTNAVGIEKTWFNQKPFIITGRSK
jgi:hypothetical protein